MVPKSERSNPVNQAVFGPVAGSLPIISKLIPATNLLASIPFPKCLDPTNPISSAVNATNTIVRSLLFFFFRSFKVVLISMIVVVIAVTWSFGTIGLFGFEITVLMGLIPPLIIVIGIPNCIYLINKYQQEYRSHGNKVKSLQRVIRKVGNATFLTNATTSMGFGTFVFTHSSIMKEFGIVASINIICIFFISILVVPIIYSYLSPPSLRHTKHLDKKWLDFSVDKLVVVSTNYRTAVYVVTVLLLIIGFYGMSLMHTTGNIVDELPKSEQVVKDLKYFESEINGVMPFELVIKSKDTIYNTFTNLSKIQNLQIALKQEKYLSKSLSLVDAIKFVSQAYGNGKEEKYFLDFSSSKDKKYLSSIVKSKYFKNTFNNEEFKSSNAFVSSFIDSSHTKTRITVQVADIGTASMDSLYDRVKSKIDEILNPEYLIISNLDGLTELQKDSSFYNVYQNSFWIQSMVQDSLTAGDVELIMDFPIEENEIYVQYGKDEFQQSITNSIESKYLQSSDFGGELTPAQLKYCASDVIYLHKIKDELNKMLIRENRKELYENSIKFLKTRIKLDQTGFTEDIFQH